MCLTPGKKRVSGWINGVHPGKEAIAYLPLLNQSRQADVTCILVDMPPFHKGIFAPDAAGYQLEVVALILLENRLSRDQPSEDTQTIYKSLKQCVQDHLDYIENVTVQYNERYLNAVIWAGRFALTTMW